MNYACAHECITLLTFFKGLVGSNALVPHCCFACVSAWCHGLCSPPVPPFICQ